MESGPGPIDSNRRWQKDPELNFAARLLFSNKSLNPHKIAEILSRLSTTARAPTRQMIVSFSRREVGGFEKAFQRLEDASKDMSPLSVKRTEELTNTVRDLIRLTPEKDISPWMHDERKRTLAALLLSMPQMQLGEIVRALNDHFHSTDITLASFHKPMRRWKLTSENPENNPRQTFAEALARDCERFDPTLYAQLMPLAKDLFEKARIRTRVTQSQAGVKAQRERTASIHREKMQALKKILSAGQGIPPLSAAAKERLTFPPFKNLVDAIRERKTWRFHHHVAIDFFRESLGNANKSAPNLVDALVITFHFEYGTKSTQNIARKLQVMVRQEFREMQNRLPSQGTAIAQAMLTCSEEHTPLLRAFWRERAHAWSKNAALQKISRRERRNRRFEITYPQLMRLLGRN